MSGTTAPSRERRESNAIVGGFDRLGQPLKTMWRQRWPDRLSDIQPRGESSTYESLAHGIVSDAAKKVKPARLPARDEYGTKALASEFGKYLAQSGAGILGISVYRKHGTVRSDEERPSA